MKKGEIDNANPHER
jgi:hypothetical protein